MKRIAIPCWSTGDNSFGVTKPYLEYFSQFGQVEMLTPRKGIVEGLDLVVLPGGLDTFSHRYGQVPGFNNTNCDAFKEYFYEVNLPQYINAGTPIFGICLGFQMLNIYFGGELIQNIWWDHGDSTRDRSELAHIVYEVTKYDDEKECWLINQVKEKDAMKVNSLHHQGIQIDGLGNNLKPLLLSEEGIVEAFEHKELLISGVQFHPKTLGLA